MFVMLFAPDFRIMCFKEKAAALSPQFGLLEESSISNTFMVTSNSMSKPLVKMFINIPQVGVIIDKLNDFCEREIVTFGFQHSENGSDKLDILQIIDRKTVFRSINAFRGFGPVDIEFLRKIEEKRYDVFEIKWS